MSRSWSRSALGNLERVVRIGPAVWSHIVRGVAHEPSFCVRVWRHFSFSKTMNISFGRKRVFSLLLVHVLATGAATAAKYLSQVRIQPQPEPAGKRVHVFLSWFNSLNLYLFVLHASFLVHFGAVLLPCWSGVPANAPNSCSYTGSQIRGAGGCCSRWSLSDRYQVCVLWWGSMKWWGPT